LFVSVAVFAAIGVLAVLRGRQVNEWLRLREDTMKAALSANVAGARPKKI